MGTLKIIHTHIQTYTYTNTTGSKNKPFEVLKNSVVPFIDGTVMILTHASNSLPDLLDSFSIFFSSCSVPLGI